MADPFKLHLPVDSTYRALVPELATRYAELAGGSSSDAAELAQTVAGAFDRVASGANPEAAVDLSFRPNGSGVLVELSCNGHRESVTVKLAVAKS